jgi:SAM-dependent methyltransferase
MHGIIGLRVTAADLESKFESTCRFKLGGRQFLPMVACCPSTRYRSPNITTESHTVHDTAREHGRLFFQLYGSDTLRTVVELGSQDVNGTLREHCPLNVHYIGLDIMPAKGVDLVINPDLPLPLVSESVDAVVTSSAFEHDVCFWATFLELVRILRPGGLLYVNVPSNGAFHRYPLDCWRFYPDAGVALTRWAVRNGMALDLLESFIGIPQSEKWGDFVAVFRKAGGAPLVRQAASPTIPRPSTSMTRTPRPRHPCAPNPSACPTC